MKDQYRMRVTKAKYEFRIRLYEDTIPTIFKEENKKNIEKCNIEGFVDYNVPVDVEVLQSNSPSEYTHAIIKLSETNYSFSLSAQDIIFDKSITTHKCEIRSMNYNTKIEDKLTPYAMMVEIYYAIIKCFLSVGLSSIRIMGFTQISFEYKEA